MKKLSELYNCNLDIKISGVKNNSKEVKPGDLFVCTKGVTSDRHNYIDEAIKNGCSALIVGRKGNYKIPYIVVKNPNKEFGSISKKYYDNPLKKISLIGITGTDGKTTTASIIRNMLGNNSCGYIGTNGAYIKDEVISLNNTTPEINKTYELLNKMLNKDLSFSTMEISSESLLLNRTNTLKLDVAIVTNITEDHLNVHKTIDNYIKSKKKIFSLLKKKGTAILNRDDKYFNEINSGIKRKVLTYGKNKNSDMVISNVYESDLNTEFYITFRNMNYSIKTSMLGEFNVYNICSALLCLFSLGYSLEEAIERVDNIEIVPGRCERIDFGQKYKIILDYAHTEKALENVLTYLNKIKKGRIITVTGSAGGREKEKRSKMGTIVLKLSDMVIFTSDDPRYEKPLDIINEMLINNRKDNFIVIISRKEAIKKSLSIANDNDIILIAGKGRDNYMAIENKKIPYSDYEVIKNILKKNHK